MEKVEMRFSRALTAPELEKVLACKDGESALTTFYNIALGDEGSSLDQEESITPWHFAIPEDQWLAIAGTVNQPFMWMNKGPTTVDHLGE